MAAGLSALGARSNEESLDVVHNGVGPWVLDARGRPWFDTLSGTWLTNIGHGRHEIADAVDEQMRRRSSASDGTVTLATVALATKVAALAPDPDARVLFVSSGSDAVETAVKMARKYHRECGEPGRFKVISSRGSYHGCTPGRPGPGSDGSDTGFEYGPLLSGVVGVQGPDEYRPAFCTDVGRSDLECALEIERAVLSEGPDTVAAVLGEPISAAAGVHVPHPEYWPMVREICDRYGVLLILDEGITAFGRTGKMFASEHWGVKADITTVGKGLAGGYAPIGAAIASDNVSQALTGEQSASDGRFAYGGNPVACTAGLAALEILTRERLVENSRVTGRYLYERAHELYRHRIVGHVRGGLGLMCAVELVRDRASAEPFPPESGLKHAAHRLMDEHGLLGLGGNIFFLAPSLCVTRIEVDALIERVDAVIAALDRELRSGR